MDAAEVPQGRRPGGSRGVALAWAAAGVLLLAAGGLASAQQGISTGTITTRTVNVAAQYDPPGNQVNSDFGRLALPTDEARQIELSLKFLF